MSETTDIAKMVLDGIERPVILADKRGVEFAFIPQGAGRFDMKQLTPANEIESKPAHLTAAPKLQTTKSLTTYLTRFKTDATVLFADVDSDNIVAVIDYDAANSASPGLKLHRATLHLPTSLQWDAWTHKDGVLMTQKQLAEFVQENARDFVSPAGINMLELVLTMEKTATIHVARSFKRAGSDQGSGVMNNEIHGTELPANWALKMPIYRGEDLVDIGAFAREKMQDGENYLGYALDNPERAKEDEFFRIAKLIADETAIPIVLGTVS